MLERKTKMVKVYVEDWETLNRLVGRLQADRGQRMTFADAVHECIRRIEEKADVLA